MKVTYRLRFFSMIKRHEIVLSYLPTIEELKYHPLSVGMEVVIIRRIIDGEPDDEPMRIYFEGEVITDTNHPKYRRELSIKKYGACIYMENIDRFCWFNPKTDKRI